MNDDNFVCQGCLFSVFLHTFPYFEKKVQNLLQNERQNWEVSEEYCIPQGEILAPRSRTCPRFQFAKLPNFKYWRQRQKNDRASPMWKSFDVPVVRPNVPSEVYTAVWLWFVKTPQRIYPRQTTAKFVREIFCPVCFSWWKCLFFSFSGRPLVQILWYLVPPVVGSFSWSRETGQTARDAIGPNSEICWRKK